MPRATRTDYATEYAQVREVSKFTYNEHNDCAVVALSLVTGKTYAEVLTALTAIGRKPGRGTYHWMEQKFLKEAGFKMTRVFIQEEIIERFPRPHCDVLKNMTTHHPRRFPGCVSPDKKYLAYVRGHVLAITGGVVQDWSINSSLRITGLYIVEPIKP